jgi:V/A-type H+-transporting ATPase subunit C
MTLDTQYAYAVARVRAIEKKLLDKSKIDRMVDAKSANDAVKILGEAGYGLSGGDIDGVSNYEKLLDEENKKVYDILKEIAPEPEIFKLFLQRNDYHNAKVILKSEFLERDVDDILVDSGSIPASKLKLMIKERSMSDMPSIMRKAVDECIDTFNRTGDPQVIDIILDRALFRQMGEIANSIGNRFVVNLVRIYIDLANIKTFLRVKSMGKSWDFLQKILLDGGSIDNKIFLQNLQEPLDSFVNAIKFTQYGDFCEEGIEGYKNTGSLTKFEKLSDNFILSFVKNSKFVAFGVEPLIGYLVAKETEIKNARIIMVGKVNKIPGDIIRERLRETYV